MITTFLSLAADDIHGFVFVATPKVIQFFLFVISRSDLHDGTFCDQCAYSAEPLVLSTVPKMLGKSWTETSPG